MWAIKSLPLVIQVNKSTGRGAAPQASFNVGTETAFRHD